MSRPVARVLVADNDEEALDLALLDLRLEGHAVQGAAGSDEVMALIPTFEPDVVVLDYRMPPGSNGLDIAEQLQRERPELRLVIYSNYRDVSIMRRAEALGIPFLPKGNLLTLRAAVAG